MTRFRTLRGRLTALAVLAAFVALAALTVAFNLLLARSLDADANRRLRSQAAAASTTVVYRGGHLVVRESGGRKNLRGHSYQRRPREG